MRGELSIFILYVLYFLHLFYESIYYLVFVKARSMRIVWRG